LQQISKYFQKSVDKRLCLCYNPRVIQRQQVTVKANGFPAEERKYVFRISLSVLLCFAVTGYFFCAGRAMEVKPNAKQGYS
jgi:hypothetical protein